MSILAATAPVLIALPTRSEPGAMTERAIFEARAATPLALTLLLVVLAGFFGIVAVISKSVLSLLVLLVSVAYWPYAGRVILRIREGTLEYLSGGGLASALRLLKSSEHLVEIQAGDVRGLEWDGFDNIGIRLSSGEVARVNCRLFMRSEDCEPARPAILAFVERATGTPPPDGASSGVAPWLVRRPAHPSA